MLKLALYLIMALFSTTLVQAQTDSLIIPRKPDVKKGTLYYQNGEIKKFNNLSIIHDKIVYTDWNGTRASEPLAEIDHIDKRAMSPGAGAAIGGLSGLVVGLVAGSIAYPDRSFGEWLIDEISGEEYSHDIKKEEIPIILGCTLGGAAIGALIGTGKKEKTIYQHETTIDVFPGMTVLPGEQNVFSMNVVIHIH